MKYRRVIILVAAICVSIGAIISIGPGRAESSVGHVNVGDRITYWFWADSKRVYATAYNFLGLKAEFYSLDTEPLIGPLQRRFDTVVLLPGQRVASTISTSSGAGAGCSIAINGRTRSQVNVYRPHQVARCS